MAAWSQAMLHSAAITLHLGETQMTTETNMAPEVAEYIKAAQRGAFMLARGSEDVDIGRGSMASALALVCAASVSHREEIVPRCFSLVTTRTDENKGEVDAAKEWFRDFYDGTKDSHNYKRATQDDEPDVIPRHRANNKAQAIESACKFAAHVLIALDHCKVYQQLSPSKQKGSMKLTTVGASIIWPDKKKSLDEMDEKTVTVRNKAGAWRMSYLESMGKEIVMQKGLRKRPVGKATPLRDAAATMLNSIEGNDTKTLNTSVENRLAAFNTLIALVDMLNDRTFVNHLDSNVVAPFRAHVEAKLNEANEAKAKDLPRAA
jgi:hypothetical protein